MKKVIFIPTIEVTALCGPFWENICNSTMLIELPKGKKTLAGPEICKECFAFSPSQTGALMGCVGLIRLMQLLLQRVLALA